MDDQIGPSALFPSLLKIVTNCYDDTADLVRYDSH